MGWSDVLGWVGSALLIYSLMQARLRTSRGSSPGVAQVELDYVTPRFRDFSPGEFVYRRSGLFRDRGFRKVITPAGMVAPDYDQLGMRREGDAYVLDIG
jgi:hypothetical protein